MEYFSRLKNFWFPDWNSLVWLLFALPALYFFQTTMHEGTHAAFALFSTGHLPKVAPFPHITSGGNFLNGVTLGDAQTTVEEVTRTRCDSATQTRIRKLAGFPAAPQIIDLALIVVLSVLFFLVPMRSPFVRFLLRAWYLGLWVDFMYNTARALIGGCKESTDWSKFMLEANMGTGGFAVLTWLFWLAILSHFIWVYWSAWGREALRPTGFWDYRWVALVLGVLSLIAVILSAAISDNAIHKDTAAFILPLIIQIGALVWYWIYFGLTFRFKPS